MTHQKAQCVYSCVSNNIKMPHLACLLLFVTQIIHTIFQVSLTRNRSEVWMFHLLVYHFAIPLPSCHKFCNVLIYILLFLNMGRVIFSWCKFCTYISAGKSWLLTCQWAPIIDNDCPF